MNELTAFSGAKIKDKTQMKTYLSAALMRRPKFGELTFRKWLKLRCCQKNKRDKLKFYRIKLGRERLDHDLDVRSYLRAYSKVKGMVHSLLDDKQKLMLKYQRHRVVSVYDNENYGK